MVRTISGQTTAETITQDGSQDGDLWSAFSDIELQVEMNGTVCGASNDPDALEFKGNLTARVREAR
jgi:hypothetical protein